MGGAGRVRVHVRRFVAFGLAGAAQAGESRPALCDPSKGGLHHATFHGEPNSFD